ncbi:MAG: hypothetical protein ACLQNE_44250 [Thermoguttaceae bacterium]
MRAFPGLALGVLSIVAALPGCGPAVSQKDLGKITYNIPKAADLGAPYELPPAPPGKGSDKIRPQDPAMEHLKLLEATEPLNSPTP